MGHVDWSARPDQIEGLALREVTVSTAMYRLYCFGSLMSYHLEICSYLRTLLRRRQDTDRPNQRCANILLRRYPNYQGIPSDS